MIAGLLVFGAASIAAALSTSSESLIVARAVQGLGAAAMMPLSLTLLAASVPAAKRAMAIGIWGGVSGLGVALGPVVGGAVVEGVSWQAIFWLNVPVALVAVPLLAFAVPESRGTWSRLDPVGTLLLSGAVFLGIWGLVHGNEDGWGSAGIAGTLVLATALIPAYVVWARSRPDAVLPLHLFASRGFSVANVIGPTFTLEMFGAVFLLSQYLQVVQGYSPLEAGLRTLPWTAAPMLVAPCRSGGAPNRAPFAPRGGSEPPGRCPGVVRVADRERGAVLRIRRAARVGRDRDGLTFAPSATAVLDGLPEVDFAVASSANSTIREFGVAMGIAVLTAVFLGNGGTITPSGYDGAIGPALLTGAAAVLVALVAALAAPGRNAR